MGHGSNGWKSNPGIQCNSDDPWTIHGWVMGQMVEKVAGIQCNADDPQTIHGFVSLHPFYVGGSGSQDYWKPTAMQTIKPVNNRQKKGERWTEFVIYLLFGLLPAEDPWAAIITGRGRWQIRQWRVEWNGAGGWTRYHVYIVLTGLRMKMYGNSL